MVLVHASMLERPEKKNGASQLVHGSSINSLSTRCANYSGQISSLNGTSVPLFCSDSSMVFSDPRTTSALVIIWVVTHV